MPFHVYIVEPPTLLDNLLEESACVYHHLCAIFQRVFHEQWLETLAKHIGAEQLWHPDDPPALVEARVRERLQGYRQALHAKKGELIAEERTLLCRRDAAIHAFVASQQAARERTVAA